MKILNFFIILFFVTVLLNPVVVLAKDSKSNPFSFKISAAIKEGFENNVFLDSSRKGDTFTEKTARIDAEYRIMEKLAAGAEYDFAGLFYNEYADLNLINNEGRAFLKYYVDDDFSVKAGYILDSVWYEHDKNGTYLAQGPLAEMKYYINKDLFLIGEYEFKIYDYNKKAIRDGAGNALGSYREDYRHTMALGIGEYIKKLFIKLDGKIDFNDSNDEYMNYYDYTAYKGGVFMSAPLFKKFYLTGHSSYRYKDFKLRKKLDLSAKEKQKTFMLGTTGYYNIYKSLYISAGYTYMQTDSNEPLNEYTDSITTAGLHIFF